MKIINRVLGTKAISVLIICLCVLTVFAKVTTYKSVFNQSQFLSYVITFFLSILILYIVYVLTNIIEYILLRTMKIINIKHFVIYPFIFDETIHFNPIKLLYNQECIRDVFPQNIIFHYTHRSMDSIKKSFLIVRQIREISLFASLMIVATFIRYVFNENVMLEIVILYILLFLFSFCYFGIEWKGNRRVLIENDFKEYIFSSRYCKQIPSIEYANYLYYLLESYKLENYSEEVILKIFENYLCSVICEEQVKLPIQVVKEIMLIIDSGKNQIETLFFIKLLQTKKWIGLIGKQLNDREYLAYGIELIAENIFELSNENIYGVADKAIERLKEYQCFLRGEKKEINSKVHFSLGSSNLFSSQIEVENRIKGIVDHNE